MISKAFKFRIYPTSKQIKYFDDSVRTSRFIYNTCLRQEIDKINKVGIVDEKKYKEYFKNNNLYFDRYEMSRVLTQMGNTDKFKFLKNIDSTSKMYSLKAIEKAFNNIKKMDSGFPKFKNRKSTYSFTGQIQYRINKPKFNLELINNKFGFIDIPKQKKITISCHNQFFRENWNNKEMCKINSYTISKKSGKYFISLQCDVNNPNNLNIGTKKIIDKNTSIGIDFGVCRPITTSDESHFNIDIYKNSISLLKQYKLELHRLSKILNKKRDYHKKNKTDINFWETTSYKRIIKKINKIHFKISEKRNYIQHCISKSLVDLEDIDTYILEELNLKGMMKRSGKGKSNNKSGLNRVLGDVGLYSLKTKLQYKANYVGKNVVTVDPKYTSQKCSKCGYISKLNRKTQSEFKCIKCGHTINADLNAAINIKEKYFENNI